MGSPFVGCGVELDELTVAWEDQGVVKVRELDRALLSSSSAWATLAFLFEERGPDGAFHGPRLSLRRYRKRGKSWVVEKHLTISSGRQAHVLAQALARWFPTAPSGAEGDDES